MGEGAEPVEQHGAELDEDDGEEKEHQNDADGLQVEVLDRHNDLKKKESKYYRKLFRKFVKTAGVETVSNRSSKMGCPKLTSFGGWVSPNKCSILMEGSQKVIKRIGKVALIAIRAKKLWVWMGSTRPFLSSPVT